MSADFAIKQAMEAVYKALIMPFILLLSMIGFLIAKFL